MRVCLFDLQRLNLLVQLLRRPPHPAHLIPLRGLRRFCTPVLRIHVPPHLLRGWRKPAGQQCALSLQRQCPKLQPLRCLHAAQIILVCPVLLLHARRPAVFLLRNLPGDRRAVPRHLCLFDRSPIRLKGVLLTPLNLLCLPDEVDLVENAAGLHLLFDFNLMRVFQKLVFRDHVRFLFFAAADG